MKSHAETDADFQKAADSGTEREDATGQKNNDQELNAVIKKLDTMNIMQIVCLASFFIPLVNLLGQILLLVIVIKSFSLSVRVTSVLRRYRYYEYAKISDGVRTKCAVILLSSILMAVAAIVMFIGIAELSVKMMLGGYAVCFVMAFVAMVLEIYCFIRLYTIMNVMDSIVRNRNHPKKPGGRLIIWIPIILILLMFMLSGIGAAISLPIVIQHIKNEVFTEIFMQADKVKRQAEICAYEFNYTDFADICDNTYEPVEGFGWKLRSPRAYASELVDSVEVTSTNAGDSRSGYPEINVTVNLKGRYFPDPDPKITYVGIAINDDIRWRLDPRETTVIIDIQSPWSVWDIR
ncbi:MAG: hypothetical protein J6I35_02650 [Ruminobacter sp.]|uniref:hypothetical protein n=1 Tax=Ruminobacter sp. TaxID=2774296 RepID=UPI001B4B57ED|nr:hypothetical protein [Ruminobacter sp.]MBP3748443.1 hypothetical protein [Ruminobacter sp.]